MKNWCYQNAAKNNHFLRQTPRQSDSITKGSISRLQGLNRKKLKMTKIKKNSLAKRQEFIKDREQSKKLEWPTDKRKLDRKEFWKINQSEQPYDGFTN